MNIRIFSLLVFSILFLACKVEARFGKYFDALLKRSESNDPKSQVFHDCLRFRTLRKATIVYLRLIPIKRNLNLKADDLRIKVVRDAKDSIWSHCRYIQINVMDVPNGNYKIIPLDKDKKNLSEVYGKSALPNNIRIYDDGKGPATKVNLKLYDVALSIAGMGPIAHESFKQVAGILTLQKANDMIQRRFNLPPAVSGSGGSGSATGSGTGTPTSTSIPPTGGSTTTTTTAVPIATSTPLATNINVENLGDGRYRICQLMSGTFDAAKLKVQVTTKSRIIGKKSTSKPLLMFAVERDDDDTEGRKCKIATLPEAAGGKRVKKLTFLYGDEILETLDL